MSNDATEEPQKNETIPAWRQVAFGSGFLGNGIQGSILSFFQSAFFLEVAQIPPVWVGNIMIIKQFWDGAIDPVIGTFSDNIKTKWGRRKPWMISFIWPSILLWIAMWAYPPFIGATWEKVIYFGASVLFYSTFTSLVMVPYECMVPDMSNGYHSRTFVVMCMQIFLFAGTGSASFLWSYLIRIFPLDADPHDRTVEDNRSAFFLSACIMAVPILVTILISIFAAKERSVSESERIQTDKGIYHTLLSHFQSVIEIITFPPFVTILGFSITSLVASSLFTNNLILWLKYVYKHPTITGQSLLLLQASIIFALVVWAIVSRFIGKIPTYLVGSLFVISGMGTMYNIESTTSVWIFYSALILIGIGSASNFLAINSILPDVISMNEKIAKKRREAVFYSIYGFIGKIAQGIAQMAASYALGNVGYLSPQAQEAQGTPQYQPRDVILTLTLFVSVFPIIFRCLGMIFAIIYHFVGTNYNQIAETITEDENAEPI